MSEYYAVERSGSTISHIFGWGVKKGSQRENHKYIARIQEGDHYRYFYTQAELDAYNKNKTQSRNPLSSALYSVKRTAGAATGAVSGLAQKVDNAVGFTAAKNAHRDEKNLHDKTMDYAKTMAYGKTQVASGWWKRHEIAKTAAELASKHTSLKKAASQYDRSKKAYDKTLLGKAENTARAARKAAGNKVRSSIAAGKKFADKHFYDHGVKDIYAEGTTSTGAGFVRKYRVKWKRFKLSPFKQIESVTSQTSYDGTGKWQADNRPHQRKAKKLDGKAEVIVNKHG